MTDEAPPVTMTPLLTDRVAALEKITGELRTCVVGQAAMIGLLSTLLADRGVLSREEAALIAMAGISAKDYPNMNPAQVTEWVRREMVTRRTPRGGSPPSR